MVRIDSVKLESLVLYGAFRFYSVNQKIANACFFDKVSRRYKLGYVVEETSNTLKVSYFFIYDPSLKYSVNKKDMEVIKKWCFNQSL